MYQAWKDNLMGQVFKPAQESKYHREIYSWETKSEHWTQYLCPWIQSLLSYYLLDILMLILKIFLSILFVLFFFFFNWHFLASRHHFLIWSTLYKGFISFIFFFTFLLYFIQAEDPKENKVEEEEYQTTCSLKSEKELLKDYNG